MRVAALSSHSPRGPRRRLGVRSPRRRLATVIGIAGLLAGLLPAAGAGPAVASHTPGPTSVTIAGSLQSEMGCASDWNPACDASGLTLDPGDGVWQGSFALPAGGYEYKAAAQRLAGTRTTALHAVAGGANIPLSLGADRTVKFYYDHDTHWVTDNVALASSRSPPAASRASSAAPATGSRAASAPGSRTPMATASTPSTTTRSLPAAYEAQGRDQRGLGRELRPGRRARAAPTSPSPSRPTGAKVVFRYVAATPRPDDQRPATATTATSSGTASATTRATTSTGRPAAPSPAGTPVTLRLRTFHDDVTGVQACASTA